MIIDQKVLVKITKDNINHYINRGFEVKLKDILEIHPNFLQRGSNIKIKVRCDICQKEKELKYQSYINNFEKYNFYCITKLPSNIQFNLYIKLFKSFFV